MQYLAFLSHYIVGTDILLSLVFQKSFDKLTHLDLFNNDICNTEDYRSKVFKMLPNLRYLDDADADLNEAEDSEDEDDDDDDDEEEEQNGAAAGDSDEGNDAHSVSGFL